MVCGVHVCLVYVMYHGKMYHKVAVPISCLVWQFSLNQESMGKPWKHAAQRSHEEVLFITRHMFP